MANVKKKRKKKEKADGRCLDVRFNTSSGNGKSLMKSRIPFDNLQVYGGWYPRQTHQLLSAFPEAFLADNSSGNIAKALTWKHPCVKQKKKPSEDLMGNDVPSSRPETAALAWRTGHESSHVWLWEDYQKHFEPRKPHSSLFGVGMLPVYSTIGGL